MENDTNTVGLSSKQRPQLQSNKGQAWTELTLKYLRNLPQQLDEIRATLAMEDYAEIKKHAHRIKGTAGTYRLKAVSQATTELEHLANSSDPDAIATAINKVERLVELATSRLDSLTDGAIDSSHRSSNE